MTIKNISYPGDIMKNILSVLAISALMMGLAGCNNDSVPIPEYVPSVPAAAKGVLGYDYKTSTDYWAEESASRAVPRGVAGAEGAPEVVGILPKNIQNLLCNSVHHARNDRLEQASYKLDIAKNDKLVKLLNKNDITQEEYTDLDNWMAELIELLYENISGYPAVERSFPFSCQGQDEETEAVGEVIEIDVEASGDDDPVEEEPDPTGPSDPDPVDEEGVEVAEAAENADRFIKKICFSTFAGESHDYLSSADYLVNADVLAHHIFHDSARSEEYKDGLRSWLHRIHKILITDTNNYTSANMPFQCERYRAKYKPSGFSSSVSDIAGTIVGAVGGVIDDIGGFIDSIF